MNTPIFWEQAKITLSKQDKALGRIIKSYKGETLASRGDLFHTLARSIVGQQISVKAADTIWRRMAEGLGNVTPQAILKAEKDTLRGYGLSGQKVVYLKHFATHCVEQKAAIKRWPEMEDELLIKELVALKGVGRWTAEMMLIFYFLRPDVFPVADLGLLKAISIHYNNRKPITAAEAMKLAESWRPYRSVATWYLWRALDPVPIEY